jgi:hypothetical protein
MKFNKVGRPPFVSKIYFFLNKKISIEMIANDMKELYNRKIKIYINDDKKNKDINICYTLYYFSSIPKDDFVNICSYLNNIFKEHNDKQINIYYKDILCLDGNLDVKKSFHYKYPDNPDDKKKVQFINDD